MSELQLIHRSLLALTQRGTVVIRFLTDEWVSVDSEFEISAAFPEPNLRPA